MVSQVNLVLLARLVDPEKIAKRHRCAHYHFTQLPINSQSSVSVRKHTKKENQFHHNAFGKLLAKASPVVELKIHVGGASCA
jgi:hypothetical protein